MDMIVFLVAVFVFSFRVTFVVIFPLAMGDKSFREQYGDFYSKQYPNFLIDSVFIGILCGRIFGWW